MRVKNNNILFPLRNSLSVSVKLLSFKSQKGWTFSTHINIITNPQSAHMFRFLFLTRVGGIYTVHDLKDTHSSNE